MTFDEAAAAEAQWNAHFLGFLVGAYREPYDLQVIGADNQCPLGRWLHGEARCHASLPEYQALLQEHAVFHLWGASALRMVESGDQEVAYHIVRSGGFHEASFRTLNALRRLRQAAVAASYSDSAAQEPQA
jgi:hypothetical protein